MEHFLLTNLLMPRLLAAGHARVVNVSSSGHRMGEMRFDYYNFANGENYNKWYAYGQSKTAVILLTVALAKRLEGKGEKTFSLHPGGIMTNLPKSVSDWAGFVDAARIFEERGFPPEGENKNLGQDSACTLVAALDPALECSSGLYLNDGSVEDTPGYAHDPELAERLWALSEDLVRQKFVV